MKIKTSELTGAALDWVVAKCEDKLGQATQASNFYKLCKARSGVAFTHGRTYSPSTNWAQGGPIIERNICEITKCGEPTYWEARAGFEGEPGHAIAIGPSALIAACRCYVKSKLGDEVDVPPELQEDGQSNPTSNESGMPGFMDPSRLQHCATTSADHVAGEIGFCDFHLVAPFGTKLYALLPK